MTVRVPKHLNDASLPFKIHFRVPQPSAPPVDSMPSHISTTVLQIILMGLTTAKILCYSGSLSARIVVAAGDNKLRYSRSSLRVAAVDVF